MDSDSTALLTVDLHRGHLDPDIATLPVSPDKAEAVVASSKRLLDAARGAGYPVIHVTTAYRDAQEILTNPKWSETETDAGGSRESISEHNVYGRTEGMDIMPSLAGEDDIYLQPKKRYSPFIDTDLPFVLRTNGIEQLVVAGVNTNTCVQCTCFEATNRDYEVTVVEECVDSMDGQAFHELGLKNIEQALGTVRSLEATLSLLED
jgi:nicotinamidase-related amidase